VPQISERSGFNEYHGNAFGYSINGALNSPPAGGPVAGRFTGGGLDRLGNGPEAVNQNIASANVMNLQRRVAGVLPVAIEVPRAGTSFSFVRPLVLDEETKVTFSYKSR